MQKGNNNKTSTNTQACESKWDKNVCVVVRKNLYTGIGINKKALIPFLYCVWKRKKYLFPQLWVEEGRMRVYIGIRMFCAQTHIHYSKNFFIKKKKTRNIRRIWKYFYFRIRVYQCSVVDNNWMPQREYSSFGKNLILLNRNGVLFENNA